MRRAIPLLFALLLAVPLVSHAQDQKQAATLAKILADGSREINTSASNLSSMARGLPEREVSSLLEILGFAATVEDICDRVQDVAWIYSAMVHPKDIDIARGYLIILLGGMPRRLDIRIDRINRELANLRSPAAIAEVQKIRDKTIQLRDQIRAMASSIK